MITTETAKVMDPNKRKAGCFERTDADKVSDIFAFKVRAGQKRMRVK